MLASGDVAGAVMEILEELAGEEAEDVRQDKARASLACHSAELAGKVLAMEEMRELVCGLEWSDMRLRWPHGLPIMVYLSWTWLEKQPGRG